MSEIVIFLEVKINFGYRKRHKKINNSGMVMARLPWFQKNILKTLQWGVQ